MMNGTMESSANSYTVTIIRLEKDEKSIVDPLCYEAEGRKQAPHTLTEMVVMLIDRRWVVQAGF